MGLKLYVTPQSSLCAHRSGSAAAGFAARHLLTPRGDIVDPLELDAVEYPGGVGLAAAIPRPGRGRAGGDCSSTFRDVPVCHGRKRAARTRLRPVDWLRSVGRCRGLPRGFRGRRCRRRSWRRIAARTAAGATACRRRIASPAPINDRPTRTPAAIAGTRRPSPRVDGESSSEGAAERWMKRRWSASRS